jgi:hypothetical protein
VQALKSISLGFIKKNTTQLIWKIVQQYIPMLNIHKNYDPANPLGVLMSIGRHEMKMLTAGLFNPNVY